MCIAGCSYNAADDNVIKLGLADPLTGDAAIYGNASAHGAQIAVDEINAMENPALKFMFKTEENQADGEIAVNAYNSLIDWSMDIPVGTVTSGACIAVAAKTYEAASLRYPPLPPPPTSPRATITSFRCASPTPTKAPAPPSTSPIT